MTNRLRFADRPSRTKIAIIGFTSHGQKAPYDDPDWELWPLNDLYFELDRVFSKKPVPVDRLRWFQLHGWQELQDWGKAKPGDALNPKQGPPHPRDPNHVSQLREMSKHLPVYLREWRDELPDCLAFPYEAVFQYFTATPGGTDRIRYFTNSISWMLALAIVELTEPTELPDGRILMLAKPGATIGVWGVDMMQAGDFGSEYGWQRPSCEWLLGWARAAGMRIIVPDESDLLKSAFQYGDDGGYFRKRIGAYKGDIIKEAQAANQQMHQARDHLLRMEGARSALEWLERSHLPSDTDGSPQGRSPLPKSHQELRLLLEPKSDGREQPAPVEG